jgi:glucose/arabinose dehydrogenase
VPEVVDRGQGGLLDVALAPDFSQSRMIYLSFSEPRGGRENGTSVARARLETDDQGGGALTGTEVIFRQTPAYAGDKHFGSRLAFAPDGTLFVTVGERSDTPIRDQAQDISSGLGKIFRINPDGSVPNDNPFVGREGAQPEIWSYGHRNLQSATIDANGRLWTVEHGPRGGDELNRPQPGRNYGWPVITYGINYNGAPIGDGITSKYGMEQPIYYWDPVIAPSGMDVYDANAIPEWQGALLVGGLQSRGLVVLRMEDDKVATEEWVPLDARVRDVKVGSDGAVYALAEQRGRGSSIVRIAPAGN